DTPAVLLDWHGAQAFAAWLSAKTGLGWRLPNELEREKAARGADARRCPWGDQLDATFACALDSQEAQPGRMIVDSYPFDASVYRSRGLAGNTRDWCPNPGRREGPPIVRGRLSLGEDGVETGFRALRGGAWSSPLSSSRAAVRFGGRPDVRRT